MSNRVFGVDINGNIAAAVPLLTDGDRAAGTTLARLASATSGIAQVLDQNANPVTTAIQLRSGIPFCLPGSGSVAANGALTLGTAFDVAYMGGAYLYFPAGAVFAGSVAGWYWVVMSTVSAGVIYRNTYAGGVPAIPAANTAIVAAGPGAYTQTTAAVNAITLTLQAGSLGPHGWVRVTKFGVMNNSAGNKSSTTSFGGTAFASYAFASATGYRTIDEIGNTSTTSQIGSGGIGLGTGSVVRGSVNTALAQTLVSTLQLAAATDTVTIESIMVEAFAGA